MGLIVGGVIEAHGKFDGDHVGLAGEGVRCRRPPLPRPSDSSEKILQSGRPYHPPLHQVIFVVVEDLVNHPGTEETGGAGHQVVTFAVDVDVAAPREADLQLDLVGVGMSPDPTVRCDCLVAH